MKEAFVNIPLGVIAESYVEWIGTDASYYRSCLQETAKLRSEVTVISYTPSRNVYGI